MNPFVTARFAVMAFTVWCLGTLPLAAGDKPASPVVPPGDEIEILDPQVDPEGKPRSIAIPGVNGQSLLTTAPTVLVHRFYYTGDRDFQGPFLQGGPVMVVACHPATGEQTYIEVQLPPGAPRVFYTKSTIAYQYRDERVVLKFGTSRLFGQLAKPAIVIRQHKSH